ncbi:2-hydroxyacyl-CoA dehydratase [Desulfosporosinus fructosivorans]|uniref:2-hydroxyacyl-CoA dehydratase n=1 Tax=Desulfosporosinus fructosivorans TaxID=2018669 RepID=A0A4Z0R337_9FIRM|nr:2-hydroxyacyl-CoA dehydratase family protein [Desulfosporosinus fructosivorans]TGE37014.1 2-hydroxyacyl-CoA dehydratase [Desulfosporosinus fructosivorans]
MEKLKELAFFEDLLTTPNNALVEKAVEAGRIPIGYNCFTAPEPLLSVGKAFAVRLRAPQTTSTELANFYMSPFTCSYSRSILEAALDDQYDFLRGMVFAACCVQIQRTSHNYKIQKLKDNDGSFVHYLIDVPRKMFDGNIEPLIEEFKKVAELMSTAYGIDINDDAVKKAVHEHNEFNKILKKISDLRKLDHPKITGSEWHTVYTACKVAPKDMLIEPLKKLKVALDKRQGLSSGVPRIMVMGSILDNSAYIELMESQGCVVVADRFCFGSLPGMELISEDGDIYRNLALYYLETNECPRMMEKTNQRIEHAVQYVEEYKADGIIFETMQFCDVWGYEKLTTMKALEESGIPIVRIEREYAFAGEGQLRTRVQAFIESIVNKQLNKQLAE